MIIQYDHGDSDYLSYNFRILIGGRVYLNGTDKGSLGYGHSEILEIT